MEPITREEKYLAAMTGANITPPAPVTRHEMYLAAILNKLSEGATGGGVSSWNDLTDKPFGEEEVTIIDGEITFENLDGMFAYIIEDSPPISGGQTVTVVWDGTTYSGTTFNSAGSFIYFGNSSFLGIPGGEEYPFVIFTEDGLLWFVVDTSATEVTTHNVQVNTMQTVKIPAKYTPVTRFYVRLDDNGVNRLWTERYGGRMVTRSELFEAYYSENLILFDDNNFRFNILFASASVAEFGYVIYQSASLNFSTNEINVFNYVAYTAEYVPPTT